jgi:hypothetical protein
MKNNHLSVMSAVNKKAHSLAIELEPVIKQQLLNAIHSRGYKDSLTGNSHELIEFINNIDFKEVKEFILEINEMR